MPQSIDIIDGGVGTELHRRGAQMDPGCWSSGVHLKDPQLLLSVHQDYLEAGVTVLSANTFMANRHLLERSNIHDVAAVNQVAVKLAREARARFAERDVLIAGCMTTLPPMDAANDLPRGPQVFANYREQAMLLAEAGVDVLLAEMLLDSETALGLLEACCATGLPVWAGVSAMRDEASGEIMTFRPPDELGDLPHETFDSLLASVSELPVAQLGAMHTPVELMDAALSRVIAHWPGPRFAYAKTGMAAKHEWEFGDCITPDVYADEVSRWIDDHQVTMVGGCCGTHAGHIQAIRRLMAMRD